MTQRVSSKVHGGPTRASDARGATRVAVVGYGYWGSKHVRVLSAIPGVEVTVVDARPERRAAAHADFPMAQIRESLDDALPNVDGVVIATPARSHTPLGLRALEAGVDVLIEKPLATSTDDALALIAAAERSGSVLMVGHTFEYNPAVWRLRSLIEDGTLGDIYYLDSARLNLGLYQPDVNVLWDLAPHDVSIANYLLRAEPSEVSAWGHAHAGRELVDVAYVQVQYRNPDVSAYIHVSWLDPSKVRRVTVAGSSKMAVYDDMAADERIRVHDKGLNCPEGIAPGFPLTYRSGDIVSPYVPFDEPLAVEDRHFVECIRDLAECRTPGRSGLAVVRVLEAADRSLVEGRTISLEAPVESRGVPVAVS